jgi:hypothetical protein
MHDKSGMSLNAWLLANGIDCYSLFSIVLDVVGTFCGESGKRRKQDAPLWGTE